MDPQLLDYYNRELTYMREAASEFAQLHPKIARRLGMQGVEVADPYVERLIESFCFMSARMGIKLDAEFPRFSQRLLEVVYPNYVAPTPSMAVAQLHPNAGEGDLSKGFVVPRGTSFFAKVPEGETTACEFRSGQDVSLWPIEIVSAKLAGTPPDIPALERYLPPTVQVAGSLRIRLRVTGELNFCDLKGLDRLPIYLPGDVQVASRLFEMLHVGAIASLTGVPDRMAEHPHVVTRDALVHEGRLASDSARRYGTRTPYVGTEVFVSLVDQQEAPYPASLRYLSVQALLTNRDLPRLVPRNGHSDLSVTDSLPLSAVGLVRAPSQPRAPFAQGEKAWRLIRQLNFNYLPLMDMDTRQGAQALRDMLRLFVGADDAIAARQVDGLIGSRIAPVTRRLPGNGPLVYGRGVQCDLTVDEDAFSGTSPYLFGLVLEHYLARHVSINVFTETRLESMQRGMVASWDARMGTRSAV